MSSAEQNGSIVDFGNFSGRLEKTVCPVCPSPPEPRHIFRKSEGIDILHCPGCGIQYASPRFDEPSLLEIYENEAFSDMSRYDDWSYESWQLEGDRGWHNSNHKTQLVKRYLQDGDRVLDVGCATGEFVAVAGHNGLAVEGIDNSKMLVDVAQRVLNVPVQQVDIQDFRPAHKFKGIVIWDVLEHLYDPVGILRSCADLMEPGGFLFAQVPNLSGISNRFKSFMCRTGLRDNNYGHFGFPYHLYFFDKGSLSRLADAAGFEAIHFESWSHLLKDGKHGLLKDLVISANKKFCFSDYIIIVARKRP